MTMTHFDTVSSADIKDCVAGIQADILAASKHALLETVPDPKLVAVSKKQPAERIDAALNAGLRVFGENRVQEAEERWAGRRHDFPDLELHLVGGLQSNKVASAVTLFDVIQSVDRIKLADRLKSAEDAAGRRLAYYIQVNTGREDQKSGVLEEDLDGLAAHMRTLDLYLVGLMCIPPKNDDPSLHFALLKTFAKRLDLPRLSMGMSADYARASVMGATDIRIGTGVFGERPA